MEKSKIFLRTISGVLLCTMATYTLPVMAYTKDETVYSKANANGENYSTVVSTHLTNTDKETDLNDVTDLFNIENTNGEETYTQDGNSLVWNANGNDIYYQGDSQKELPIDCKVTYTLDGEEMSAEDIAGKSGKVTIKVEYENKDAHLENINGTNETLYTPFVVIAGTVIENDNNKNITITNGKTVDNGTKTVVAGIAMPGLQESLGISEDTLSIPNSIEISMDATDFELNSIVSYVTPKIIDKDDINNFDELDDIFDKVDELQSASKQLVQGANELASGTQELATGTNKLKAGVNSAYSGANEIKSQVSKATNSLASDNSDALDSNTLKQIGESASSAAKANISSQLSTIGATASESAEKQLSVANPKTGTTALEDVQSAAVSKEIAQLTDKNTGIAANITYSNGVYIVTLSDAKKSEIQKEVATELAKDTSYTALDETSKNSILVTSVTAAITEATKLASTEATISIKTAAGVASGTESSVAKEVASAIAQSTASTVAQSTAKTTAENVASTVGNQVKGAAKQKIVTQMKSLSSGLSQLTSGLSELDNGAEKLDSGANQVNSGASELASGMSTFDKDGIEKICDYVNGDVKDIKTRVEKLSDLAEQYNKFTMSNDGTQGSVRFIIVIDEIKKDNEENTDKSMVISNSDDNKQENVDDSTPNE